MFDPDAALQDYDCYGPEQPGIAHEIGMTTSANGCVVDTPVAIQRAGCDFDEYKNCVPIADKNYIV